MGITAIIGIYISKNIYTSLKDKKETEDERKDG